MSSFDDALRQYDYAFPPELIAQSPASPRDSARLLVFDRKTGARIWTTFAEIGSFLPHNALLVLNQTKVIPARLTLTRRTGGKVAALFLGTHGDTARALCNRTLHPSETLILDGTHAFMVEARDGNAWILRPTFDIHKLPAVFAQQGTAPLPPYIKHTPLTREQLLTEYQSVFAKDPGSIAAPTASLHFTPELLASLQDRGIALAYTTLHVHLGTFAPLTEEQWQTGRLHQEEYHIDPQTIAVLEQAKRDGRPIIAVGTTVVRTLESATDDAGVITRSEADTSLFIREGYTFRMVSGLITNFHVPRSSLLMLVAALTGRETLLSLYKEAIEKRFRLFSFGDAMLIL